jgi:hypothetical protein
MLDCSFLDVVTVDQLSTGPSRHPPAPCGRLAPDFHFLADVARPYFRNNLGDARPVFHSTNFDHKNNVGDAEPSTMALSSHDWDRNGACLILSEPDTQITAASRRNATAS